MENESKKIEFVLGKYETPIIGFGDGPEYVIVEKHTKPMKLGFGKTVKEAFNLLALQYKDF